MQNFTLHILGVLKKLFNESFIMFLREDCLTGSTYFTYIYFWLDYWRRFWISIRSLFCLVNTISNVWSSLYDPLCAIVLCYHPSLVPVSETSSRYLCCYIMLDPLRLVDVANHTNLTWTKGLYIPRKLSRYSVYTSTVFNGVYSKQGKVD